MADDGAVGPARVAPIGARHVTPPAQGVVEGNGFARRRKYHGAGHQLIGRRAGIIFRAGFALGKRDVAGGGDETRKLGIGHLGAIHPIGRKRDAVHGAGVVHGFIPTAEIGAGIGAAHGKFSARDPDHATRGRRGRWCGRGDGRQKTVGPSPNRRDGRGRVTRQKCGLGARGEAGKNKAAAREPSQ